MQHRTEYRCPCHTSPQKACNRLLGKGEAAGLETVCPKCGAIVRLAEGRVHVIAPPRRRQKS